VEERNVIVEKSIEFGLAIVKYCITLEEGKKYIIARQLLKSGTAIGANVFEAQHAETRADFIH
jgi:four helix bundle protein